MSESSAPAVPAGRTTPSRDLARRYPFTLGLVAAVGVLAAVSGSLGGPSQDVLAGVGAGTAQLAAGRWWTPITSALWAATPGAYLLGTLAAGALSAVAERALGSLRTLATFGLSHVVGVTAAIGIAQLDVVGDLWSPELAHATVVTPVAAAAGAAMTASARLPAPWRRRLRLALAVGAAMLLLYVGGLTEIVIAIAIATGWLGGAVLALVDRTDDPSGPPASGVEIRLLVAMVVAASAVGPLLATAVATATGPLTILQFLLLAPQPDPVEVAAVCADATLATECRAQLAALRLGGVAALFLSVVPVVMLLVLAEGLRRGRRFAWWATLGINLALAGLSLLLSSAIAAEFADTTGSQLTMREAVAVFVPVVQPLLVIALLGWARSRFQVSAPSGVYPRFLLITIINLTACSIAYLLAALATPEVFEPRATFTDLLADLPLRFVPPGYLGAFTTAFVPTGGLPLVLYTWTGAVFWAVTITACLITFRRAHIEHRAADRTAARALLQRHGGGSMAHMITWRGNDYWFSPDQRAVIGYRVISGVALTTGEPAGDPEVTGAAIPAFVRFCARNGWIPCLYSISEEFRRVLGPGWQTVQVAEEAMLDLDGLEFRGKKWQDVRSALNKARALEITAEQVQYATAGTHLRTQIREISQGWANDKAMPEMGFTLGGLPELADDAVRTLLAVGADGTVHGITSWLPIRADGRQTGWTLDIMRRRRDGFPGVMEFLIGSMIQQSQHDNLQVLSLSGAPLARLPGMPPRTRLQRLLDAIGRLLEPVYGFRSLLAFKAKFQPRYRPLYMAYPDAGALPSIATAISRAYLPTVTPRQLMALAATLLRDRSPRKQTL